MFTKGDGTEWKLTAVWCFLILVVGTSMLQRCRVEIPVLPTVEHFGCHKAISQNGAVSAFYRYTPDVSCSVTLRDLHTGEQIGPVINDVGGISSYALSPNGELVALGLIPLNIQVPLPGRRQTPKPVKVSGAVVRETQSGRSICAVSREGFGRFALAFSPDSKLLAGATLYGPLIVWDIAARKPKTVISSKNRHRSCTLIFADHAGVRNCR